MIKACISQVKELVLESLEEGDVRGVAGDMEREGFSHEEVPIWLSPSCMQALEKKPSPKTLSKVVRLVSDLLIAATDTTSITATWLLYILSQHQHIQVISILDGQLYPP